MGFTDKKKSGRDAASEAISDPTIQSRLLEKMPSDGLPCALAFSIAAELKITPAQIGNYADQHGIRLTQCQLGLFGYQPRKKIVQPKHPVPSELKQAIDALQVDGRLSCADVWRIAERVACPKMEVSAAC